MRLRIGGEVIEEQHLRKWYKDNLDHQENWISDVAAALADWYDEKAHISVQTSGSTGTPKRIKNSKTSMIRSAEKTAQYLGLSEGQRALNVLPAGYIAGRMMIYRALVSDLDLTCIEPKLDLSESIIALTSQFDFSAMTPLQLETTLSQSRLAISNVNLLIIGGAPISPGLQRKIMQLDTKCYATYGMTETITHIAMKSLNHPSADEHYTALSGVRFEIEDGCLVIDADHLDETRVKTTDVVDLIDDHSFIWKGRADHVINRGGVKLHPELIESQLASALSMRFFVGKRSNPQVGEEPVLVTEGSESDQESILAIIDRLPKLWRPAEVFFVGQLKQTGSGKIIRDFSRYDLATKS